MTEKHMPSMVAPTDTGGTTMTTGIVRLSYPSLIEPRFNEQSGTSKYEAALIFSKHDAAMNQMVSAKIQEAIKRGIEERKLLPTTTIDNVKMTLKDGINDPTLSQDPYNHDKMILRTTSVSKPALMQLAPPGTASPVVPLQDAESKIYPGCYVVASVNFAAYNSNGNRGVSCFINSVLWYEDGESFAGGITAEEAFADVAAMLPPVQPAGLDTFAAQNTVQPQQPQQPAMPGMPPQQPAQPAAPAMPGMPPQQPTMPGMPPQQPQQPQQPAMPAMPGMPPQQ